MIRVYAVHKMMEIRQHEICRNDFVYLDGSCKGWRGISDDVMVREGDSYTKSNEDIFHLTSLYIFGRRLKIVFRTRA